MKFNHKMKTIKYLPLLFILNNQSLLAQTTPKSDWVKENLKGKVKTLKTNSQNNDNQSIIELSFNEKGYILEKKQKSLQSENQTRYEYDEYNRVIQTTHHNLKDHSSSNTSIAYQYDDAAKKLITTTSFSKKNNGLTSQQNIQFYDDKGNIIKNYTSFIADSPPPMSEHFTYRYNSKNQLIEINQFFDYNNERFSRTLQKYNKQGRIKSSKTETKHHYTFLKKRYDQHGNKIWEKVVEKMKNKPKTKNILQTKYVYDEQGNWIQKISHRDNQPMDTIQRTIEYYP